MKIFALLLDVLGTYHEIYWLYRWIDRFFERKELSLWKNKKTEYILKVIYTLLIFLMNRIELISVYTVCVAMLVVFAAVKLFWKNDLVQTFAVVGGYFFTLFWAGNIVITLTGILGGSDLIHKCTGELGTIRAGYLIFNIFLWYLLNELVMKYVSSRSWIMEMKNMKLLAWTSIVGFVGSCFLGAVLINSFSIKAGILWYLFFFMVLLFLFGNYFVIRYHDILSQMEILNTKNSMLERNYMQINDLYTANAQMYHDMKHHYEVLYYLMKNEEQESAMAYLEKLRISKEYSEIKKRSGIKILDVIFHEMDKKASEKGVILQIEVPLLPNDLGIESSDICSFFSNLLENAIEAAEKAVFIKVKKINRTILVIVKNDFTAKPMIKNGKFITSKKDKIQHGWGIQIIEQIVREYEGSIEYKIKENLLEVSVLLNEIL